MKLDPEAGDRLREFMQPRIGKVQPWSERHGIGRDTIYALWRGREPQPDTMARIANAMGVTYERLLRARAGISEEEGRPDDLVAALRDQTRAIDALVAALRGDDEASEGLRRGREAARALQGDVVPGSRARRPAPPSTRGSGR